MTKSVKGPYSVIKNTRLKVSKEILSFISLFLFWGAGASYLGA